MKYTYNNGLRSGSRTPRLILGNPEKGYWKFEGKNIPGIVVILSERYEKNGKWSNTTYNLEISDDVTVLEMLSPLHGLWGDKYTSFEEMSADTGIPVDIMKNICKEEYPKTYERISASEALLGGLSTKQEDVKEYVIVTRHKGLVEWLKLHGIEGEVIEHATPEQISGKNVVGVLPLNLAALAATITTVDMALPAEKRGVDLTPEEMDSFGATMNKYRVMKV